MEGFFFFFFFSVLGMPWGDAGQRRLKSLVMIEWNVCKSRHVSGYFWQVCSNSAFYTNS